MNVYKNPGRHLLRGQTAGPAGCVGLDKIALRSRYGWSVISGREPPDRTGIESGESMRALATGDISKAVAVAKAVSAALP